MGLLKWLFDDSADEPRRIDYKSGYYYGHVDSDGEEHGHGKYYWNSGDWFEGEHYHGRATEGTLYFKSGNKYVGGFDGYQCFSGRGTYYWKNGEYVTGTFYNNTIQYGTFHFLNGVTVEGNFINWNLNGECKYTDANGYSHWCIYQNGKYIRRL